MGKIRSPEERRYPTGIGGLDRILHGGLLRGASYAIAGGPGTGKTVLSAQLAFHHARLGEQVAFISVLAEPYGSLLENLASFSFFDHDLVHEHIAFLSAYSTLEPQGLEGLHEMMRQVLRSRRPSLVVLDNASTLREFAPSDHLYRACLRKLIAQCSMSGAILLILTDRAGEAGTTAEFNVVDGLISLRRRPVGMRAPRILEIGKSRGSAHIEGEHPFDIGSGGLEVFPRMEAALLPTEPPPSAPEPASTGIEGLDRMLRGGLTRGSTTGLFGASGVGKTLLGLSVLAEGIRNGERALYFGFHESPDRLVKAAEGIGLPLAQAVKMGLLRIEWRPAGEYILDRLGQELLEIVGAHRPARLLLDGIDDFSATAALPERVPQFLAVLSHNLRAASVTSLLTEETELFGPRLLPRHALSPSFENLILLRFEEVQAQFQRRIAVLKSRDSGHDHRTLAFEITSGGILVAQGGGGPAGPGAADHGSPP